MADVIELEGFLGKTDITSNNLSALIAKSRVEDTLEEAGVELCVIAFADALPIDYDILSDDDLGELVRLAGESKRFCAILHKLTIAISGALRWA